MRKTCPKLQATLPRYTLAHRFHQTCIDELIKTVASSAHTSLINISVIFATTSTTITITTRPAILGHHRGADAVLAGVSVHSIKLCMALFVRPHLIWDYIFTARSPLRSYFRGNSTLLAGVSAQCLYSMFLLVYDRRWWDNGSIRLCLCFAKEL